MSTSERISKFTSNPTVLVVPENKYDVMLMTEDITEVIKAGTKKSALL
jgi:hypothetical protein